MKKQPKEYLEEPYSRIIIPSNGSYSAEILEFPGCFAEGDTPNDAIKNLEEIAEIWIETSIEQGQDIPEPFLNQGFAGKFALRLPKSIHKQVARFAQRDGVSMNQFFVSAIASRVGAEDLYSKIMGRFEEMFSAGNINIINYQVSIDGAELNPRLRLMSSEPFQIKSSAST